MINEESKVCRICGEIKKLSFFHVKKPNKDGRRNECKDCVRIIQKDNREKIKNDTSLLEKRKEYMINWRNNNKDKLNSQKRKEKRKEWREKNKDKIAEQTKNYVEKNKERLREIDKPKRQLRYYDKMKDPLFKIKESVRNSIRRTIKYKEYKKNDNTEKILGCEYKDFKIYLESQFENWMNYDNYGKYNGEFNYGWDIDHIIPISSAKTEDEIIKLNHYTNLRPLCSKINRDIKRNNLL